MLEMDFQVAYVEVSPNFAGTIMGIVNGIANAMGIVVYCGIPKSNFIDYVSLV